MRSLRHATVGHYMVSPVRSVHGRMPLRDVSRLLVQSKLSASPVIDDDGRLVGVISLTDLIRVGTVHDDGGAGERVLELPDEPAALVMNAAPLVVAGSVSVPKVTRLLIRQRIRRVYVTEDERLCGVFAMRDVIRVVADGASQVPIAEYMNDMTPTISAAASLREAIGRLDTLRVHALVVMRAGVPIGTFTQDEVVRARQGFDDARVEEAMNRAILCLPQTTPLHRAAQQAVLVAPAMVVAMEGGAVCGTLTPTDFGFSAM